MLCMWTRAQTVHPREPGALVPVLAAAVFVPAYVHMGTCARLWARVRAYTHAPFCRRSGFATTWPAHEHMHDANKRWGDTHTHTRVSVPRHMGHTCPVDAAPPGPRGSCWPHAPLKRAVTSRLESMISSFLDVLGHVGCAPSCRQRSCPHLLLGVPGRAGRGLSLELRTLLQAWLCWAWPSQTCSALP